MSGADSLLPPEVYSTWVAVVGGLLLLAVAAWYAYVLWSTRAARPTSQPQMARDERSRYLGEVDEVLGTYRAGARDVRALHLELARIMRAFASERIGRDVSSWTRAQIAEHDPTARVGRLLADWEEPSFARRSDAEAEYAAHRAREVIGQW